MDTKMRLYHFACEYLWFILSVVDFLFEDLNSPGLDQLYQAGYDRFEDVAEWLLNEQSFAQRHRGLGYDEAKSIQSQIEKVTLKWANRIRVTADDVSGEKCALNKEARLYYLTLGWSLRILSEFEHLMSSAVNSAELRQRYQEASAKFEALTLWLRDELSSIKERAKLEQEDARMFQAKIETLADQLATEWTEQVRRMSKQ